MKNVNEATKKTKTENEHSIPSPIRYNEKSGGVIVLVATGVSSYNKYYFATEDAFKYDAGDKTASPYRTKDVKLPVSRDGITFRYTDGLFAHLRKNCNYKGM